MSGQRLIESLVRRSVDLAAEISPVFGDRNDAGRKLADILSGEKYPDPILFTIPSGGVPVAVPISDKLGLPLHLIFAAKVRFSSDRRFGIGAVTPEGEVILNSELLEDLPLQEEAVKSGIEQASRILKEKMGEIAKVSPPIPDLNGKTAIIVEDGIATGYTVLAAAKQIEPFQPGKIVIACPVTSSAAYEKIHHNGYEQIVLLKPFSSAFLVDNFYSQFPQISTDQVKQLLDHRSQ